MSQLDMDFPPPDQTPHTDINGRIWDYTNVGWVRRPEGLLGEPPADDQEYARQLLTGETEGSWVLVSHPSAEVPEAPITGLYYARFNGGWAEFSLTTIDGITDAPSDGTVYARKDAVWSQITMADVPDFQAALDLKADIDHTHTIDDFVDDVGSPITVVEEAPINGKSYLRTDAGWVESAPLTSLFYTEALTFMRPQEEDDATLFYAVTPITIQDIYAHIVGTGASVALNICFSSTRNGVGTKVFSVDTVITSEAGAVLPDMNITQIPVNNWVWVEISTIVGDPLMLHLTFDYQKA